jgi:hypothetical protein
MIKLSINVHTLRSKVRIIWGVGLYIVAFLTNYFLVLVPNFSYQGFGNVYRQPLEFVGFVLLAAVPTLFAPSDIKRPSQLAFWMMFLIVYIPSILVPFKALNKPVTDFLPYNATLLLSLLILSATTRVPPPSIFRLPFRVRAFWMLLLPLYVLMYALMFRAFGLQAPPSLSDVYDVRLEARSILVNAGFGVGYILRWVSNVLNPFLVASGLVSRRWWVVAVGIIGQIFVYSFDGTKSTLFSPFLIIGFFLLIRQKRFTGFSFSVALSATIFVAGLVDWLLATPALTLLYVRRFFMVPGLLTGFYVDFFSANPVFMWSQSFLGGLVENPYPGYIGPGFLIGEEYFGNPLGNANANFWADGFANFGIWGVLVVTVVLSLFLFVYDSLAKTVDSKIALLIIAMPFFALTNTALASSLLTHGLFFALLFLLFLPRELALDKTEDAPARRYRKLRGWV